MDLKAITLQPQAATPMDVLYLIRGDLFSLAVLFAQEQQMTLRCQEDPSLLEVIGESFQNSFDNQLKAHRKEIRDSAKLVAEGPMPVFYNSRLMESFLQQLEEDAREQARTKDLNELITYYAKLGLED